MKQMTLLIFILLACNNTFADPLEGNLDRCSQVWNLFMEESLLNNKESHLDQWRSIQSQCSDDLSYYRYSVLLSVAGRHEEAKKIAVSYIKADSKLKKLFLFRDIAIDMDIALAKDDRSAPTWNNIIDKSEKLINLYPDWEVPYINIAAVSIKLKQFNAALSYLQKSLKIKVTEDAYISMSSIYYDVGDYESATKAFEAAAAISESIFGREIYILSVIDSYIQLNNLKKAKEIANKHFEMKPGSKKLPEFIKTMKMIVS